MAKKKPPAKQPSAPAQKRGIENNPNDWAKEHENTQYILDLLLSVITVSMKTVDIVSGLPKVEWE